MRPSAEIRAVEVKKLRIFYDFSGARATLCGDSRGQGSKTEAFLRFLACARDPLRRFAWSRFKKLRPFYDFCGARATLCGDSRGRGSKTEAFFTTFLRFLRCAPLSSCGDSRGRGSKTEDFLRFLRCARDPLRRSCASKRSRCGAVRMCCSRNGLWKLSRGSRACFRNPAVAGSIPPWSAAAPA